METKSNLNVVWQLTKPISDYLYGYSLISVAVVVNILTLNIRTSGAECTNSVLLIVPSGSGKTSLIYHILQKSNPEWFPQLPEKFFESELLKEDYSIFDSKIWAQDDLITSFRGTSSKQREQLMGFFDTFLTKGSYGRRDVRITGRIVCLFGLAKEHYHKYRKRMLEATFADRFAILDYDFHEKDKERILQRLNQRPAATPLPVVKLPFSKQPVEVAIPAEIGDEVIKLAMDMDKKRCMSFARARTHILSFVKSSAYLNGRTTAAMDDLRLLKLVLPLYFGAHSGNADIKVREIILECSMNGIKISGAEIKTKVMALIGCEERVIQEALSKLRNDNTVNSSKIPLEHGYDYRYWL